MNKYIKTSLKDYLKEHREIFKTLYHGTDKVSAELIKDGIDISKSSGGYFGYGFYTTPDFYLAKSNYSDFCGDDDGDDDGGAIIEFELSNNSNILDLRDSDDFELWKKYSRRINDKNLYKELIQNGIDGLYDDSFDGVVIYNPNVLIFKQIIY